MTRLYGWAPRGRRLIDKVPHGHWKTSTFLAALRCDRVEAPCLFDGPINGERFLAYVTKFLVPTLKPDDIVVADNLGSHKGKAVRKAIRAAGARLLFLPKYSPDLNPIEQVFAKLKTLVRKAEPRTFDGVSDALKNALDQVAPSECAKYLRHAGYAYTWSWSCSALMDGLGLRRACSGYHVSFRNRWAKDSQGRVAPMGIVEPSMNWKTARRASL